VIFTERSKNTPLLYLANWKSHEAQQGQNELRLSRWDVPFKWFDLNILPSRDTRTALPDVDPSTLLHYIAQFRALETDSTVKVIQSASDQKLASYLGHGYSYEAPKMAEGGRGWSGFNPQESAQTEYARPRKWPLSVTPWNYNYIG